MEIHSRVKQVFYLMTSGPRTISMLSTVKRLKTLSLIIISRGASEKDSTRTMFIDPGASS